MWVRLDSGCHRAGVRSFGLFLSVRAEGPLLNTAQANGTDVQVQSELLRHSNIGTTLNVYTQAVSEQKRAAHGQIVSRLLAV